MTETAWLIVRQPNDLFARYVFSECAMAETDMTQDEAVAVCCSQGVPASIAPDRVHNAREAGQRRWDIVQRAIAAHHATRQGVR